MRERINWKVALPTIAVGVGFAAAGLAVGNFGATAVSALLLNVGAVIALLAIGAALQPRLMRAVRDAPKTRQPREPSGPLRTSVNASSG